MKEEFSYPDDTVWFLRAMEAEAPVSEGSAIAVRLRRRGSDAPFRNFLITCAHVIRKEGASDDSFGACYAEIKAWRPGSGFNLDGGKVVYPVTDLSPFGDSPRVYEQEVGAVSNSDWVLLEFKDDALANAQHLATVQDWIDVIPSRGVECQVFGYPGGSKGFAGDANAKENIVTPSLPYGHPVVTASMYGMVEFQGSDSRKGMSGGGVFTKELPYALVGIHRQRTDSNLQLHAVSAMQIRTILETKFEFPVAPYSSVQPHDKPIAHDHSTPTLSLWAITDIDIFDKGENEELPRLNISRTTTHPEVNLRQTKDIDNADLAIIDIRNGYSNSELIYRARYVSATRTHSLLLVEPTDSPSLDANSEATLVECPVGCTKDELKTVIAGGISRFLVNKIQSVARELSLYRRMWGLDFTKKTVIVQSQIPDAWFALPEIDTNRMSFFADVEALYIVSHTLSRLYPTMTVEIEGSKTWKIPQNPNEINIVVIGGPDTNSGAAKLMDRSPVTYEYSDVDQDDIQLTDETGKSKWKASENQDYGFMVRNTIRHNGSGVVVFLGGAHVHGVTGIARFLEYPGRDSPSRHQLVDLCLKHGDGPGLLVSVTVDLIHDDARHTIDPGPPQLASSTEFSPTRKWARHKVSNPTHRRCHRCDKLIKWFELFSESDRGTLFRQFDKYRKGASDDTA
ncbi:MAG: hypothetical protein AAGG48_17580 [Planctomycetota bacterium]